MEHHIQFISTVGFPICACFAMGYYVKYITDKNNEKVDTISKEHKQEMDKITQALNNNTLAIQKLTDSLLIKYKGGVVTNE